MKEKETWRHAIRYFAMVHVNCHVALTGTIVRAKYSLLAVSSTQDENRLASHVFYAVLGLLSTPQVTAR